MNRVIVLLGVLVLAVVGYVTIVPQTDSDGAATKGVAATAPVVCVLL